MMQCTLRIGQLATQLGLNPKTIRYYEDIGLLPTPQRSAVGYRLYSQVDAQRLGFILKARQLGFTLEEIREILCVREQDTAPCAQVEALLDRKLAVVEQQLRKLTELRRELLQLRSMPRSEHTREGVMCGMIEEYARL